MIPTRDEYLEQPVETRLARLARTPDELAAAARGHTEAALSRRPGPKRWAAKDVVCHLRDLAEQFLLRLRTMLAMDDPKFLTVGAMPSNSAEWGIAEGEGLPLDPDRWAEERKDLRNDAGLAPAAFRKRRQESLAFLGWLTPARWRRGSVPSTLGRLTE